MGKDKQKTTAKGASAAVPAQNDKADTVRMVCGWCDVAVEASDPYIVQECTACGHSAAHSKCIIEFLVSGRGDRRVWSNTRKAEHRKEICQKSPHRMLVGTLCYHNRSKKAEAAQLTPCPGVCKDCDLVNPVIEKPKVKKKKSELPALPSVPRKSHIVRQSFTPSQLRAAATSKPAVKDKHALSVGNSTPPRLERERSRTGSDFDDASSVGADSTISYRPGLSSVLEDEEDSNTKRDVRYLTPEQVEVAVREGFLPADFRTRLCPSADAVVECPGGPTCPHAHSLQELRVGAAIAAGHLPENYKMGYCASEVQRPGSCKNGIRCELAHSVKELRVKEAIAQGLLPPEYKQQLCADYEAGHCPEGISCFHAHGASELRRESAVEAGLLPGNYKFQMCTNYAAGTTCRMGDKCTFAHGPQDIRLAAAINQKKALPSYKTLPCASWRATGRCPSGRECLWYHGEHEKLPIISKKCKMCPTQKETGWCEYAEQGDCYFAHSVDELRVKLPAWLLKGSRRQTRADAFGGVRGVAGSADNRENGDALSVGRAPSHHSEESSSLSVVPGQRGRALPALTLCATFSTKGICNEINCTFAHGEQELSERQRRYRERQMKRKNKAAPQPQPLQTGPGSTAGSQSSAAAMLTPKTLAAIRKHKLSACMGKLVELGFNAAQAEAAARATGASVDLAAAILLGESSAPAGAHPEVSIASEVAELAQAATALGLDAAAVEAQVLRFQGDYQAALQELQCAAHGDSLPPEWQSSAGTAFTDELFPPEEEMPGWDGDQGYEASWGHVTSAAAGRQVADFANMEGFGSSQPAAASQANSHSNGLSAQPSSGLFSNLEGFAPAAVKPAASTLNSLPSSARQPWLQSQDLQPAAPASPAAANGWSEHARYGVEDTIWPQNDAAYGSSGAHGFTNMAAAVAQSLGVPGAPATSAVEQVATGLAHTHLAAAALHGGFGSPTTDPTLPATVAVPSAVASYGTAADASYSGAQQPLYSFGGGACSPTGLAWPASGVPAPAAASLAPPTPAPLAGHPVSAVEAAGDEDGEFQDLLSALMA